MYDGDPRKHLSRAKELLSDQADLKYSNLRYAALDLRLAIETTVQEELTAWYIDFSDKFSGLWSIPDFAKEIRRQNTDFDLKARLTPIVLKQRKQIVDYRGMDLGWLAKRHGLLSDHLHHLNRYDSKKGSQNRADDLRKLLDSVIGELEKLLKYPRQGIQFHDQDERFFQDILLKRRPVEEFEKHIEHGFLKSVSIKNAEHRPD